MNAMLRGLALTILTLFAAPAFSGLAPPPAINSTSASNLTSTSARLNATVTTYYATTTVSFEYKAASQMFFSPAGSVTVPGGPTQDVASVNLGNLVCAVGYQFRVTARNGNGQTGPTSPVSFTTLACATNQPHVTLSASATQTAGAPIALHADVSGGTAPLRYDFDLDGDGVFDRSGSQASLDVTYPGAFDGNVTVRVVDATGANDSATTRVRTTAPNLVATATGAPTQVCGDGDGSAEPGERFALPVRITNSGTAATQDGYAVFNTVDSTTSSPGGSTTVPETHLLLDTPALAVGNLAPGASVDAQLTFEFASDTPCGRSYAVQFAGGVDAGGSSAGATLGLASIAVPSTCQVFTACPKKKALATPRQGLYYNPARSGNGLSNFLIPNADGSTTFFGAWFTANADRTPTWYIVQGNLLGAAVKASIYSFKRDVTSSTFKVDRSDAGRAVIVQLDPEHALMAWTLGTRQGAESLQFFTAGDAPSPNHTGAWYNAGESGWGEVIHQFVANGVPSTFTVDYLYDAAGAPRWVIGQGSTTDFAGPVAHSTYAVQCPGCPWIADWSSFPLASGAGSIVFDGATSGRTTTSYTLPAPLSGTWTRTNLPIQLLSVPQ